MKSSSLLAHGSFGRSSSDASLRRWKFDECAHCVIVFSESCGYFLIKARTAYSSVPRFVILATALTQVLKSFRP